MSTSVDGKLAPSVLVLHEHRLVGEVIAAALAPTFQCTTAHGPGPSKPLSGFDVVVVSEQLLPGPWIPPRWPPIIVVSGSPEPDGFEAALARAAGVQGWIPVDASHASAVQAVGDVLAGRLAFPAPAPDVIDLTDGAMLDVAGRTATNHS